LNEPGFDVSFLDLFAIGVTDNGRKLFFSMGTASEIAEARAVNNGLKGFAIGNEAQDFCGKYVRFLVSQNLIQYDFTDYLIDWEDRLLQPIFLCPLTPRGRNVLDSLLTLAGDDGAALSSSLIAIMEECVWDFPNRLSVLSVLRQRIIGGGTGQG
jgi:hypothetical protein